MTTRAHIYTRISKDASGEGASNERQEAACRALAEARGWTVVSSTRDVSISAYTDTDRPGWEEAKRAARNGECDVIVAWHLDRITRSMIELEELIKLCEDSSVGIATATGDIDLTTDVGRMVARILAAVARAEVERKGARQRLAYAQRAEAGKAFTGGFAPFGYQDDRVTADPEEAAAIRKAAGDLLAGKRLSEIADEWNEKGLVPRHAKSEKWNGSAVGRTLKNPRYASIAMYKGAEVGDGEWEPILTREEHYRVRAFLNDPKRWSAKNRSGGKPLNLLTKHLVCGECGNYMRASTGHYKGQTYLRYRCKENGCTTVDREKADAYVIATLATLMHRMETKPPTSEGGEALDIDAMQDELENLIARQSTIARMIAFGDIDPQEGEELVENLRKRVKEIQDALAGADSLDLERVLGSPEEIAKTILEWPLDKQRQAVSMLNITATKLGKGTRRRPIEERLVITPKE